jgi:hypothetical protein
MNREEMQARYNDRNAEIERLRMDARISAIHGQQAQQTEPARAPRHSRLGDVRHILGLR